MKNFELKSPDHAEREIAKVIASSGFPTSDENLTISCRDENAFLGDIRFPLGRIRLAPKVQINKIDRFDDEVSITKLLRLGAYEWITPNIDDARKNLSSALGYENSDKPFELDSVLANIASIVVRSGFSRPTIDPSALEQMPYKSPTTIVVDTSGVLQGGMDFVASFLHPAARVKVPAIVNMEITNSAENYFSLRRSNKTRKASRCQRELEEHLKSQGGQRALLRLELQADTEVERTFLLGDPLREAFATDNTGEVSGLNISIPNQAYADRLILEAARHHQAQTGPTHQVRLLTGDQGLARMALAEGITPLFFRATKSDKLFGTILTGRTFHPFTGRTQSISLAKVLWEYATSFGEAKIINEESGSSFTVCALGKDMSWSPYHSLDDLLWCSTSVPTNKRAIPPKEVNVDKTELRQNLQAEPQAVIEGDKEINLDSKIRIEQERNKVSFLRFNVSKLFQLICVLDDIQELSVDEVCRELGLKSTKGADEYFRFLSSASLVHIEGGLWTAKSGIATFASALRNKYIEELQNCFQLAPSYKVFTQKVNQLKVGEVLNESHFGRGISTYRTLGEIGQICAEVRGEGIYATDSNPDVTRFASLACERFAELEGGDGLVATGAWLEALIRKDGIHPIIARRKLDQASRSGLIRRSTEGSTTQIRNDRHVLNVLKVESGIPKVDKVHLYRGDFLIPGKASVSLRIREASL